MTNEPQADLIQAEDSLPPCGLFRRLASMIYDGLLLIALWMLGTMLVVIPTGREVAAGDLIFQAYLLIIAWAYFAVFWRYGGQTVGMKAWRIKLITEREPAPWLVTLVRFMVALPALLCFGLGFAWSLFHPDKATWHDLASGSRLVVIPRSARKVKSA